MPITSLEKCKNLIDGLKKQGHTSINPQDFRKAIAIGIGVQNITINRYIEFMNTAGLIEQGGLGWVLK